MKKENLKQHFESNFLDGDKMPCKAVTFTDSGAFDVAEYFYKLGRKEMGEEILKGVGDIELAPDKKTMDDVYKIDNKVIAFGYGQGWICKRVEDYIKKLINKPPNRE